MPVSARAGRMPSPHGHSPFDRERTERRVATSPEGWGLPPDVSPQPDSRDFPYAKSHPTSPSRHPPPSWGSGRTTWRMMSTRAPRARRAEEVWPPEPRPPALEGEASSTASSAFRSGSSTTSGRSASQWEWGFAWRGPGGRPRVPLPSWAPFSCPSCSSVRTQRLPPSAISRCSWRAKTLPRSSSP